MDFWKGEFWHNEVENLKGGFMQMSGVVSVFRAATFLFIGRPVRRGTFSSTG